MNEEEVLSYDNFTVEEMLQYVSIKNERKALKNQFSTAGEFTLQAVSGHAEHKDGFSIQTRDYASLYAYEMVEGGTVPLHRRRENQVLINHAGDVLLRFEDEGLMPILLGPGDVYDMPKGTAFSMEGVR